MAVPPTPVTDQPITAAWGTFVHDKVSGLVMKNFTKTTTAAGLITVTNTELGLTAINGAICGVQWNAGGTVTRASARLLSGAAAVMTGGDSVSIEVTGRTGTVTNAASVGFWIIAWGVGA